MRTISISILLIGLALQSGCASFPKFALQRKSKPQPTESAEFLKARDLERLGKHERAREAYEALLDESPDNPAYMHRLGVVCTHLQRYGEADDYFARARKRDPKNAALLTDMGYSYHLRDDDEQAERLLREAVHLKPSDKRANSNLALVVGIRGKLDESLSLLEKIGDKASAFAGLAYIHARRGEWVLAERRFNEALTIDPEHQEAKKGLAEIAARKPHQDDVINAKATTDTKRNAFEDFSEDIQQAAATDDPKSKGVITANFTEESFDPAEPGLLDKSDHSEPKSNKPAKAAPKGIELISDEQSPTSERVGLVINESEEEWAAEDEETSKAPKPTVPQKRKTFDFESDDEPSSEQTTDHSTSSTKSTLKFVPTVKRMTRKATRTQDDADWDSPTE